MAIERMHEVAESMYSEKLKRLEERECPKKYCDLEFRAVRSHPQL